MTTTPEIWLSERSANAQTAATETKIVALANGNFVVLWVATSDTGVATDTGFDIVGQIYDPFGQKVGGEFLAETFRNNTSQGVDTTNFEVAARPDGGFVIVTELVSASTHQIVSAERRSDGSEEGAWVIAESTADSQVGDPSISMEPDGSYLVSYQRVSDTHVETNARRIDVDNSITEADVITSIADADNAANDGDQQTASAYLSNGNHVVVGRGFDNGAAGEDGLYFRLVDNTGQAIGFARGVGGTTQTISEDTEPSVAALNGGGFVVVWKTQNGSDTDIQFVRYNNNGQSQGSIITVSDDSSTDESSSPSVTALDDGGFMIVWIEEGVHTFNNEVLGQRFDSNGNEVGDEIIIQAPDNTKIYATPDVEVFPDGRIGVSWDQGDSAAERAEFAIYDPRGDVINGLNNTPDTIVAGYGETTVRGDGFFGNVGVGGDDTLYAYGDGDRLFGQRGNDKLYGAGGKDYLNGGEGADIIDGGGDKDTLSYAGSSEGVTANLQFGTFFGGDAEGDVISNVEHLEGSSHNDHLTGDQTRNNLIGGDGDDELYGRLGDDDLEGGKGADFLHGGSGLDDWAIYRNSETGVDVGVDHAAVNLGGEAEGDVLIGIENLGGSDFDDTLTGNTVQNTLDGGDGNDVLNASSNDDVLYGEDGDDNLTGGRGADYIDGGDGIDTANYSNSDLRVTVDLDVGDNYGAAFGSGHGAGDRLVDIENIFGSKYNDHLTGDDGANEINGFVGNDELFGEGGNDKLLGGGGHDFLDGGAGNDSLRGGGGSDIYRFSEWNHGHDIIEDWQAGIDKMDFSGVVVSPFQFQVQQIGADVRLSITGNSTSSVTLKNVDASDLDESDFIFNSSAIQIPDTETSEAVVFEPEDTGGYLATDPIEALVLEELGGGGYLASDEPTKTLPHFDDGGYLPGETEVEMIDLTDFGGYLATDDLIDMLQVDETGGYLASEVSAPTIEPFDAGGYLPAPDSSEFEYLM